MVLELILPQAYKLPDYRIARLCRLCDLCRNILYILGFMHKEHFSEKGVKYLYLLKLYIFIKL